MISYKKIFHGFIWLLFLSFLVLYFAQAGGYYDDLNNKKAFDVAKQRGIQGIGASDAHRIERVGKFATLFPFKVESIEDLIRGIKSNKCKPAIYKDGKYIIVEK